MDEIKSLNQVGLCLAHTFCVCTLLFIPCGPSGEWTPLRVRTKKKSQKYAAEFHFLDGNCANKNRAHFECFTIMHMVKEMFTAPSTISDCIFMRITATLTIYHWCHSPGPVTYAAQHRAE